MRTSTAARGATSSRYKLRRAGNGGPVVENDSGASTLFINKRFVEQNKVKTYPLKKPIPVFNIDGTLNKAGSITEMAVLTMKIGDHEEKTVFTVTDIGPEDVIIGIDWLRHHNPSIDWYEGMLVMNGCPEKCQVGK